MYTAYPEELADCTGINTKLISHTVGYRLAITVNYNYLSGNDRMLTMLVGILLGGIAKRLFRFAITG